MARDSELCLPLHLLLVMTLSSLGVGPRECTILKKLYSNLTFSHRAVHVRTMLSSSRLLSTIKVVDRWNELDRPAPLSFSRFHA